MAVAQRIPLDRLLRRAALVAGLALLTALTFGVPPSPMEGYAAAEDEIAAQAGDRPNIVVVMTDDQDLASVGVMRKTRRMIGRQGTTFTRSFATFPLCCPSRATFLTGQYAHNHGVTSNRLPDGGYDAFRDRRTLPTSLRRAGYRTGYVGKYLNGWGEGDRVPRGWHDWYGLTTPYRMFRFKLNENGQVRRYARSRGNYQTDVLARKSRMLIRQNARRNKPFFLTLQPTAPHGEPGRGSDEPNPTPAPRHRDAFRRTPLPRPPSFNERDVSDKPSFIRDTSRLSRDVKRDLTRRHRSRLASLLAVDDAVAAIVRQLRRTGELHNTVIFFTSDNGWMLGEHRLRGKPQLYEETARVPLMVRGPGFPSNLRRSQLTGNIDLAPTILDLASARSGRVMDGQSLLPFARDASVGTDRSLLLQTNRGIAVRTPDYMYARYQSNEEELYDMGSDPFQLESRHDDPAMEDTERPLAQRLEQLEDCRGARCR